MLQPHCNVRLAGVRIVRQQRVDFVLSWWALRASEFYVVVLEAVQVPLERLGPTFLTNI